MVRIILEQSDIEKLIKDRYPGCEIISEELKDIEITIRVDDIKTTLTPARKPTTQDAMEAGLTVESREHTIPGGPMGRNRNNLPTF